METASVNAPTIFSERLAEACACSSRQSLIAVLCERNTLRITSRSMSVPFDDPIGPVFTKAKKYVLTRGSTKFDWANSHKLSTIDELKKVKAEEGPDIVLWGSSTLYPQLLDANLIDRFLLLTCPIVLGKGKNSSAASRTP